MQKLKPTCKTYPDGIKVWQLPSGKWHREKGPAYIKPNGYRAWFWQDQVHNAKGLARTWLDGNRYRILSSGNRIWYWYDHRISKRSTT